jgi:hypothetical protein
MRHFVIVVVLALGGTVGLCGCTTQPPDPYTSMRMLTPEEAGATVQEQDPVLQAEKEHNARFANKGRQTP